MAEKTYRVIQWATGTVGKAALKYFIENPVTELVGVLVTNPDKVGKDAGELVGLPDTGIKATDDVEAIIAMDADCVFYAALHTTDPVDPICRLLESGKNVISTAGPFLPNEHIPEKAERIAAACKKGGSSYHGAGIHPGFSGDILPLTLTRLMNRVDRIEVTEVIDKVRNPMVYTEMMGFGTDPQELLANPRRSPDTYKQFYSSMTMLADSLGVKIDEVTTEFEVSTATADITHEFGMVKKGTVGGQHYAWTAWADGAPFIVYHFYWQLGTQLDPVWDAGADRYNVKIEGDPPLECHLMGTEDENGNRPFHGLTWTGLVGCTALPDVCDAPPGVVTHLDMGVVRPKGLVRR